MSEPISILQSAREAHQKRQADQAKAALRRVERISPMVTAALGLVIGFEPDHPVLADMIWVADKAAQSDSQILAVTMTEVSLESSMEGKAIRAVISGDPDDLRSRMQMAFAIETDDAGAGQPWVGFKSLAELGSHLV